MPDLEILPVANRRQRKQFLNLPWQLYDGDPNWVPPLRQNQKELVGFARHPFYDDAEGQTFLAIKQGRPAGRILAVVNHAHNRRHKATDGFFGFFESVDDQEVAAPESCEVESRGEADAPNTDHGKPMAVEPGRGVLRASKELG